MSVAGHNITCLYVEVGGQSLEQIPHQQVGSGQIGIRKKKSSMYYVAKDLQIKQQM